MIAIQKCLDIDKRRNKMVTTIRIKDKDTINQLYSCRGWFIYNNYGKKFTLEETIIELIEFFKSNNKLKIQSLEKIK